jgi:hypothetical protein
MNPEKKRKIEHCLKILQLEFPDAHAFTLALKVQVSTGYEVQGRQVMQFLKTGSIDEQG